MNEMTITDFLLARIAEDEAIARAATPGPWDAMTEETSDGENIYYTVEHGRDQVCDMSLTSMQGRADAEHTARNDPARVLGECAAKRAIIAECRPGTLDDLDCGEDNLPAPMWVARTLAAVYASHRDYRQEWARG